MGLYKALYFGFLTAAFIMLAGCSRTSPSKTIDAADFCEMPVWRKPAEARNMARTVALRHAREQLQAKLQATPAGDKMTVEDLAMQNAGFRNKMLYLIQQAPYDESEPKKGVLVVTVHLDEAKFKKLVQQYAPASLLPSIPGMKKEPTPASEGAAKPIEAKSQDKTPEDKQIDTK